MTVDETHAKQMIERMSQSQEVPSEVAARSVSNTQPIEESGIAQAALIEILKGFAGPLQLQLIEGRGLAKQIGL